MSDFSKPRFPRPSFGKKPLGNKSFGNRGGFDRGPREMFKADCAKCGDVCEVPFRPNGTKPVYCNNCFVKDAPSGARPSFQNDRNDRAPQAPRHDQAFNDLKAELRVVNQNLERLITLMTPAPKAEKVTKKKSK